MLYDLSVIIAVYNSSCTIETLINRINACFTDETITMRILLVDDCSMDDSPVVIDRMAERSANITAIHLKKNYGQQNALLCGLRNARNSRYVATIDDDLQQAPEILKQLYQYIVSHEADIVYAVSKIKHSKLFRRIGSAMRDAILTGITLKPKDISVSSLRIMNAQTAENICAEERQFVYLSASAFLKPIRAMEIDYERQPRPHGKSGYTPKKLIQLYWNLFIYYTRVGALFRPRCQRIPYEITKITLPGRYRKRLMILGGSRCQMNAFVCADKLGYQTILADYLPNPPAALYADLHLQISTFDTDACFEAASNYRIDGIMTMGTDQPVLTAATISKRLRLAYPISEKTAYAVTNKKAMKAIMRDAGIPTVAYQLIDRDMRMDALADMGTPLVIKPLDSQGQRGVFKLETAEEIFKHLNETLSFSALNEALVEEYYPSDEITVSAWVSESRLFVLSVTDRKHYPDEIHIGICTEHRFPSLHMNRFGEFYPICEQIVEAFSIKNGPLYIQILIGGDGVKVNEIACRIGGAFEDVFIPYITSFNILDAVMLASFGKRADISVLEDFDVTKVTHKANVQLIFCKSGRITSITPEEEILALPYVADVGYNYKQGDTIPSISNATARFGHCVILGRDEAIEDSIKEFYRTIRVCSESGENLICIPDEYRTDTEGANL